MRADDANLGTAVIAQAGVWILVAIVWAGVFSHEIVPLFAPHPVSLLSSRKIVYYA
jgi:hypothetical protein